MTVTRISAGAYVNGTNNAGGTIPLNPVAGTFAALDLLLLYSGSYMGAQTIADPSGWTRLSPNVNSKQSVLWGKIAAGGDTIPSVNWGANAIAWACVDAYRGCLNDITQVVDVTGDDAANSASDIRSTLAAKTPGGDGYLGLAFGTRNKTSTSDASTFTAPANFTKVGQLLVAGTNIATARCEWIQSSATTVPTLSSIGGSIADGTNQASQYILVFLKPAIVAPSALLSWPKQTFVTETLIQS